MNKLVYTQDVKQVIKDLPVTLDAETVQRAIEAVHHAKPIELPDDTKNDWLNSKKKMF